MVRSQPRQIGHGLIPTTSARGKAGALNAKKVENSETSHLNSEFEPLE